MEKISDKVTDESTRTRFTSTGFGIVKLLSNALRLSSPPFASRLDCSLGRTGGEIARELRNYCDRCEKMYENGRAPARSSVIRSYVIDAARVLIRLLIIR